MTGDTLTRCPQGGEQVPKTWEFYTSPGGASVVRREITKCRLTRAEQIKLGQLMQRAQEGALLPKDCKDLKKGLRELRLDCGERIFRLFYSEADHDKAALLLAVKFMNKKATQGIVTDSGDIATARKRLSEWQNRNICDDQGRDTLK